MDYPLIVTLALEEKAFQFFNALRTIYFPKDRNFIDAHLTLFHHLPHTDELLQQMQTISAQQSPFTLQVQAPRSIGNGVAFPIECAALAQLHKSLQQQWAPFLIPQDRQKLWPHVTVQNKVPPEDAKQLLQFLTENFSPFVTTGTALQVWEYHGGPWQLLQSFPLQVS